MAHGWSLLILGTVGQGSQGPGTLNTCLLNNFKPIKFSDTIIGVLVCHGW